MKYVALVSLLIASAASASGKSGASDADAVTSLQHELIDAYIHRDASVLKQVLADDYTFTNGDGSVVSKKEVLRSFAASGDRTISTYVMREEKVRVYGSAAVMTYAYTSTETYRGRDDGGSYRITRVFIRMNGKWRIVAGQETKIVVAPSGR